jgi:hypothetical protein
VLTEDQLIDRLRTVLAAETADLHPRPGRLDAVRAELAVGPPRRWRPVVGGAAGLVVAAAVALAAVVLVGHRTVPPPRATAPRHASPPAPSPVAAPVRISLGPVTHYCDGKSGTLVACRGGQRPVVARVQRLVTITVPARRATGSHSWYAWSFTAPSGCSQASDGGPTRAPVRAGSRLVFQALLPVDCRGIASASVVYVTQAARADRERFDAVGRGSVTVP